jgi:hypothetical protein
MQKMDTFEDITFLFVLRSGRFDDEAAITLKGHLLSEYLLNRIIESKLGLNKTKNITYSKKLYLLKKYYLLPEEILLNLRLLNSFRNRLVHELDVSISEKEMIFHKPDKKVLKVKIRKGMYPQRYYLRLFCHGVLNSLRNHMLLFLKVDPRKESIFA